MFRTYIVTTIAMVFLAITSDRCNGQEGLEWVFPGAYTIWQEDSCQLNQLSITTQYNDLLREHIMISTPTPSKSIYRGKGETTYQEVQAANVLQSSNTTISWMMPVNFSRVNDFWGVRIRRSALGYGYALSNSDQSTLGSEAMSREFLYSLDSRFLNSRISASIGTQEENQSIWSCGLNARPLDMVEISYRHRSDAKCYRLSYEYDTEPIDMPLAFTTSSDLYRIRLSPRRGIRIEGVWNIIWLGKNAVSNESFQIDPRMEYQRGRAMLSLQLHPVICFELGWNYSMLQGNARLLYQNIWCGKTTMIEANLGGPNVRMNLQLSEHQDLTIEWEQVSIDGELSGHLEFWPFAPTLIDLLGLRRYYHGWCEAKGYRYSGTLPFTISRNLHLVPMLQVVDVILDARLDSWRPVWLVFGKDDERISQPRIHRLQAALLKCNLSNSLRWATLTGSIQQWIPIRTINNPSAESLSVFKDSEVRGLNKKPMVSEPHESISRISAGGRIYTISMLIDLEKLLGH